MVKLVTLLFISITGLVVLGGHTSVAEPLANFSEPFKGKITPYGATTAMYRIIFSYAGYENSFNVTNEIKVCVCLDTTFACLLDLRTPSRQSRRMVSLHCSW